MINWICNLYNKAFGKGVVLKDWRRTVIMPFKGDKRICRNFRGFILLSIVEKMEAGNLVERIR